MSIRSGAELGWNGSSPGRRITRGCPRSSSEAFFGGLGNHFMCSHVGLPAADGGRAVPLSFAEHSRSRDSRSRSDLKDSAKSFLLQRNVGRQLQPRGGVNPLGEPLHVRGSDGALSGVAADSEAGVPRRLRCGMQMNSRDHFASSVGDPVTQRLELPHRRARPDRGVWRLRQALPVPPRASPRTKQSRPFPCRSSSSGCSFSTMEFT